MKLTILLETVRCEWFLHKFYRLDIAYKFMKSIISFNSVFRVGYNVLFRSTLYMTLREGRYLLPAARFHNQQFTVWIWANDSLCIGRGRLAKCKNFVIVLL